MIDALPPVPQRSTMDKQTFVMATDQFLAALPVFRTQANDLADTLNNLSITVGGDAGAAAASALAAQTAQGLAEDARDEAQGWAELLQQVAAGGNMFASNADMVAAEDGIEEGAFALVLIDEEEGGDSVIYQKVSGDMTLVLNLNQTVAIADVTGLQAALDAKLAGNAVSAFGLTLIDDDDASTARATLGLVIGTNVQAYNATLTSWAGKTVPSGAVVGTTDTQTMSGKTLTAPVITDYTETVKVHSSGTAFTIDLADGTKHRCPTTGNATITLPSPVVGKSFEIRIEYGGAHTISWAGGSRKWHKNTALVPTGVNGKADIVVASCSDGSYWDMAPAMQNL